MDKAAKERGFPFSVSLHHCSILTFILILLLSEREAGEDWEPWN